MRQLTWVSLRACSVQWQCLQPAATVHQNLSPRTGRAPGRRTHDCDHTAVSRPTTTINTLCTIDPWCEITIVPLTLNLSPTRFWHLKAYYFQFFVMPSPATDDQWLKTKVMEAQPPASITPAGDINVQVQLTMPRSWTYPQHSPLTPLSHQYPNSAVLTTLLLCSQINAILHITNNVVTGAAGGFSPHPLNLRR